MKKGVPFTQKKIHRKKICTKCIEVFEIQKEVCIMMIQKRIF